MKTQLAITLAGDVGQGRLDTLRERLGLRKRGRLSDDQDEEFGHRDLSAGGEGRRWMDLWRDSASEWTVRLAYETDPLPAAELEALRDQVVAAADALGWRVVREEPSRGQTPGPEGERVAAARERLAAWMTEKSPVSGRHFAGEDLVGFSVGSRDEWLTFTPPARANRVYLVSDDTVYSFAPSRETLESAIENARAERG